MRGNMLAGCSDFLESSPHRVVDRQRVETFNPEILCVYELQKRCQGDFVSVSPCFTSLNLAKLTSCWLPFHIWRSRESSYKLLSAGELRVLQQ